MARSREDGDRLDRDEEGPASAAGGGGGGGIREGGTSGAGSASSSRAAEARAAASSSSVLGGDGGGGGSRGAASRASGRGGSGGGSSGVDSAAPRRAAEGVSSLPSGGGGGSDRIVPLESERAARILLLDLVEKGLESARAALSTDEKSLSRREARMRVLEEINAQIRELKEDIIEDRGGVPTPRDIASMLALKSIQQRYKHPDAREIVGIIARHVSSAARTVAGVAASGARSAANKMQEIGRVVRNFFVGLAEKLGELGTSAAQAVAKGCIKMANGIDTGVVSVANTMSDVGLVLGDTADKVLAPGKKGLVYASDALASARHSVGTKLLAPQLRALEPQIDPSLLGRKSTKGDKLKAIDDALTKAAKKRKDDSKGAKDRRTKSLEDRTRSRLGLEPAARPDPTPHVAPAPGPDAGHGAGGGI